MEDFAVDAGNQRPSFVELLEWLEQLGEVMRSYADSVLDSLSKEPNLAPTVESKSGRTEG